MSRKTSGTMLFALEGVQALEARIEKLEDQIEELKLGINTATNIPCWKCGATREIK